jgi:RHS repeat-associated protein
VLRHPSWLLMSDSLSYDKMSRIRRAWQQVRQQNADQTLISYDGLGAVVAKEQGSELGSSVEEFRNDAFGNVLRRLTRKTAGTINNAPFAMSYGFNGALLGVVAQLKSPPEGIYQKEDDLAQGFTSGRMTRQGQIVRNPSNGVVEHQVAARHYFGADDRLMAVQRYSWRGQDYRDGTWEEYRYDALGRRIATRVRRHDTTAPYAGNVSGPLCQSTTPICRSYVERVWWDGDTDQALFESRTPEGTADVSNDDYVGNIHGVTLDEPLAVISHRAGNVTRIINYNWRGQGLSSVFPDGSGADFTTGSTSAEVDWPAETQRETYFTPAPEVAPNSTPKKWLGTFVQNGIGTTGMLYRRNRYFDTKSGRFTQEDPTGIATGLNVYGFADGDPVNFSDPFGLCPPKDFSEVLVCTGRLLQPVQGPLEIAGSLATAPLAGMGMAGGRIAALGLSGRAAASKLAMEEGIYEFAAISGRTYVGQSAKISSRLVQHVRSGKLAASDVASVRRTQVLGGKVTREVAEQLRINELGGISRLENKVNPIGPARKHLLDLLGKQ